VYLLCLCAVSLLSSRFTASALVWFYNFLKYGIPLFISLSTVFIRRSPWILCLFIYQGTFKLDRRILLYVSASLGHQMYTLFLKLLHSHLTKSDMNMLLFLIL
jgi:hypothetical protein